VGDAVITWKPVFEVEPLDDSAVLPWPVALDPPWSWVVLDGDCTDEQIGLFVTALASRIEVAEPGGRAQIVDALVGEEVLILNGGVRLEDSATAKVVVPGCCAGLENWREWAEVLSGSSVYLGHDPDSEVEVIGEDLRVWQDGKRRDDYVDVPLAAVPGMLVDVRRDLVGFLDALAGWADRIGLGERGAGLVKAIDDNFAITAPWDGGV
jgi:hypothetical protein